MKVARVTVRATAQGLWWGFQTPGRLAADVVGILVESGAVVVAISAS
jgi:hypothetical protein